MGRGQAATEYLIMFAIAVIIALIAVGALSGFPDLGGGMGERESIAYWTTANVGITKYILATNSQDTRITFRNNNNYPIMVENVTFGNSTLVVEQVLSPGQSTEIGGGDAVGCPTAGMKYYVYATIYYTDVSSGSSYGFYGMKPLVGTCQKSV